ncbi:Hypothetical predicted protein [Olea europaea subsp. europaea]|uniref:Uncharacterized protein n=1 Tax=Olea europaea subsp. europaea TaxID=158383 RepID=A0A8S0PHI1_OLEEU|nr:Hypothetical predicted protein [Olea europaea subsp. europaea]
MMEIRSSMTFLSDSVITLISSTMDAILTKATEKSEAYSVGDAPQQEKVIDFEQNIDRKVKSKMDPVGEIEYPAFSLTPSFDLGVVSTLIISNEVDVIIASVVNDCGIEEQADVAMKTINEDQSPYITNAGKQIKHSDDAIIFYKHDKKADKAHVVAFQNWFNRVMIIFVIKYAEYILRDDIKSMQMNFDVSRAKLDIATRLFKHKDIKKPTQLVQSKGESIVVE